MSSTYFVTGALGCIGAWVVKTLAERGDRVVVFDLGDDRRRLTDVMDEAALASVEFVQGDITDGDAVLGQVKASGAKRIVHLAGLQVPFCKADPALGARVNVLGTIHVLQAALECGVEGVAYASSAAVYGPDAGDSPDEGVPGVPLTHYGVYKAANEGNARIFFQDNGLSSVGIRPLTVYGVGRDQGLTSGPTRAMKAASIGRSFQIPFSGATDFNYVGDTAQAFITAADRCPEGAHVFNLHGDSVPVTRIVETIQSLRPGGLGGEISCDGPEIPIPPKLDGAALENVLGPLPKTPLEEGIATTMERFAKLQSEGRLRTHDLDE